MKLGLAMMENTKGTFSEKKKKSLSKKTVEVAIVHRQFCLNKVEFGSEISLIPTKTLKWECWCSQYGTMIVLEGRARPFVHWKNTIH